jgi:hypothetical protein
MSVRGTSFIFVVLGTLSLPPVVSQTPAPVEKTHKEQQAVDLHGDPLPPGAVARLGTVRLRHIVRDGSGAASVAFSSDGKRLITCGDVGVCVWDVATGKRLNEPFSNEDKKLITRI